MSDFGAVLGGYTKLEIGGVAHDVLVLGAGLLLMVCDDTSPGSQQRLERLVGQVPIDDLVRRHRLIPWSHVLGWRTVKRTPLHVDIDLPGGERLTLATRWTTLRVGNKPDEALLRLLADSEVLRPMSDRAAALARWAYEQDAMVLDAMANVDVDGVSHDLVVFDIGLVLIADPGPIAEGKQRLTALMQRMPAHEIVGRQQLLPYEQVVDARITKTIPLHAEIEMYDGRRLVFRERTTGQDLTDDARRVLSDALVSVGARRP